MIKKTINELVREYEYMSDERLVGKSRELDRERQDIYEPGYGATREEVRRFEREVKALTKVIGKRGIDVYDAKYDHISHLTF